MSKDAEMTGTGERIISADSHVVLEHDTVKQHLASRHGVATILWTRGYDGSGCSVGSVGLGGSAVIEVDLVA